MSGGPRSFVLRLVLILGVLAVWEAVVRLFSIPAFILPAPSSIFLALYRGFASALYIDHMWITLAETLIRWGLSPRVMTASLRAHPVEGFFPP